MSGEEDEPLALGSTLSAEKEKKRREREERENEGADPTSPEAAEPWTGESMFAVAAAVLADASPPTGSEPPI